MASQDILNQIQQNYGDPALANKQIESSLKAAYEPNMTQLLNEGNNLRAQYYPSMFNAAQQYGTGAADMSPSARLAAMTSQMSRAGDLYNTNLGLRDYYKTSINDMLQKALTGYNQNYSNLKDLYSMQFQKEQADIQNQLARDQLNKSGGSGAGSNIADILKLLGLTGEDNGAGGTDINDFTIDTGGNDFLNSEQIKNATSVFGQPTNLGFWGNSSPISTNNYGGINISNKGSLPYEYLNYNNTPNKTMSGGINF